MASAALLILLVALAAGACGGGETGAPSADVDAVVRVDDGGVPDLPPAADVLEARDPGGELDADAASDPDVALDADAASDADSVADADADVVPDEDAASDPGGVVDADASPDAGPPVRIRCLETVAGDLCGRPEKIIPGDPVGKPERMMMSRPGPMLNLGDLRLSLAGDEKLVKGGTHAMTIQVVNVGSAPRDLRFVCDVNEDEAGDSFAFFGRATVVHPEGTSETEGPLGPYWKTTIAPGAGKAIAIQVTPTKEYFYNETHSYLVFRVLDEAGFEVSAVTLSARVEPAPGTSDTVACGSSVFPVRYENDNGGGPFGVFNRGYTTSVCCDGVFYPMAECCLDTDCVPGRGCVDGFCVGKPGAPRLAGEKSVLVGYSINEDNTCTVLQAGVDPLPQDVLEYYARVDRFFDGMAGVLMDRPAGFVHFRVAAVVALPAVLRNAVASPDDVAAALGEYCPQIDLAAYDLVALDNNVSSAWATGFAFVGTNMALYSHVGLNTSTAVHEIAHLYGCRDYYLDLSGSLQWFDTLYGDGRYERINPALDSEDPEVFESVLDEKMLLGCRGFLGWADSDRNGVFDIDEPGP